jgi:hypothetical protein
MRWVKTLLLVASAGLLLASLLGIVPRASAQDTGDIDPMAGAWSGPLGDSQDQSANLETKATPLNITGCWSGQADDTGDGAGTAVFQFNHQSNPTKLVLGSTYHLSWSDQAFAHGPMKGKVSSSGFSFKGTAGAGCGVSGSGTGSDTALSGTIVFKGNCAKILQNVTFSITPGCI